MIYVASPYSHPNVSVRQKRYEDVTEFTMGLIKNKVAAFSPIMYLHYAAQQYQMPYDAEWWKEFNRRFIINADYIHVLMLDGWKESLGVKQEILLANELGINVSYSEMS